MLTIAFLMDTALSNADELSTQDIDDLLNGGIIVRPIENKDGIHGLLAAIAISAPREKIWFALLDYENFPKIFDGVNKINVISQDKKGALVEFWVDAVLAELHYTLFRSYDKPAYELSWNRIKGDLKIIEGSWSILDSPDSEIKILVYRSFVKVGRAIPTRLVRWGATRKAKAMCKRLQNWILKSGNL